VLGRSIEERDPAINERTEFGHWECDLVIGQKTGDDEVLLTLAERMSREYWMIPLSSKEPLLLWRPSSRSAGVLRSPVHIL
jgi:IS30 family transposase